MGVFGVSHTASAFWLNFLLNKSRHDIMCVVVHLRSYLLNYETSRGSEGSFCVLFALTCLHLLIQPTLRDISNSV